MAKSKKQQNNRRIDLRYAKGIMPEELTFHELRWIVLGLMGIKRFACGASAGPFKWPGNNKITEMAFNEKIAILGLSGDLVIEHKGRSVSFNPIVHSNHLEMLIDAFRPDMQSLPSEEGFVWHVAYKDGIGIDKWLGKAIMLAVVGNHRKGYLVPVDL